MHADGIYPSWPIFMKPITQPHGEKEKAYTKLQESVRKDVERSYGVLKLRFQCLEQPSKLWDQDRIKNMVLTCIIFHNMIIRTKNQDLFNRSPLINAATEGLDIPDENFSMRDEDTYCRLRSSLIEHTYQFTLQRDSE